MLLKVAVRVEVLAAMMWQKFLQHPDLAEKLNATGSAPTLETTRDEFWGIGIELRRAEAILSMGQMLHYRGLNTTGKILLNIRHMLKDNLRKPAICSYIIGDSIVRDVRVNGALTLCLPGATLQMGAIVAKCIAEQADVKTILLHVGTNNLAPRICDRSDTISTPPQDYDMNKKVKRLHTRHASSKQVAKSLLNVATSLADSHKTIKFMLSGLLPRFDADCTLVDAVDVFNAFVEGRSDWHQRGNLLCLVFREGLFPRDSFRSNGLHPTPIGMGTLASVFSRALSLPRDGNTRTVVVESDSHFLLF